MASLSLFVEAPLSATSGVFSEWLDHGDLNVVHTAIVVLVVLVVRVGLLVGHIVRVDNLSACAYLPGRQVFERRAKLCVLAPGAVCRDILLNRMLKCLALPVDAVLHLAPKLLVDLEVLDLEFAVALLSRVDELCRQLWLVLAAVINRDGVRNTLV